ncbi:MAG: diadenylate cyclase CdaA [Ruminococcus sp.]|nr:diadenylate cyclase CdaA [uncultured Ruminococcus sp.]MBQ1897738.1 diadenylate cyclase CdaA [Ruminococcus sp.]MBQ4239053.1 diadenylate cyclase CdaA [Ruminococcus sp.]
MGEVFREALNTVWSTLKTFEFKDAVDILIVALLLYYLFRLFRQSRSGQLVKGVVILLIMFAISAIANLTMVRFILKSVFEFFVIILVVVFQPELRQGLERLGRSNMTLRNFMNSNSQSPETFVMKAISDVADSCAIFSKSRTGALIVFERNSLLNEIAGTGTTLNSETSPALLGNIFYNKAPLHDGAMIIRDGKILSAGCILPLTKSLDVSPDLGTRHRAAIGLSEECDAVVVVVSEETGNISIALGGRLTRDYNRNTLYDRLVELIIPGENERSNLFSSIFRSRKEKNDEKE